MSKRTAARLRESQLGLIVYESLEELPEHDRPRARALREGISACSTSELLQILIGGPYAEWAARTLLGECNDLHGLASKSLIEMADTVRGIGLAKATQIKASVELGKRMVLSSAAPRTLIKTPADIANLLLPMLGLLDQEEVWTVLLDSRNRLIGTPTMLYRGCLNAANMRVGEVFRDAIRHNCASLIIAHNHPSGDPSPSADDVLVTTELIKAGKLLDIELLDHVVIGGTTRYVSLKERGLAFEQIPN
jgi:DNA repair protein RadC